MNNNKTYCGVVGIIGRSNVGKSTLLNKLLGKKISITSKKLQTTMCPIVGIDTQDKYQTIYIDTPGIYAKKHNINYRWFNKIVASYVYDVDLLIFVVEGTKWTQEDEIILNILYENKLLVILAINKIDFIKKKANLLPYMQFLADKKKFAEIIPVSAKNKINIDIITLVVHKYLPEATHCFPKSYITDCSQHFMISEVIREKLIRFLGDELPYSTTVKIESFQGNKQLGYKIAALIIVKHERQKKIVIGNQGKKIKILIAEARKDIQKLLGSSVNLAVWVKANLI